MSEPYRERYAVSCLDCEWFQHGGFMDVNFVWWDDTCWAGYTCQNVPPEVQNMHNDCERYRPRETFRIGRNAKHKLRLFYAHTGYR